MWDVFYLPYPRNKEKNWDIFLNQSRFNLDYVKNHVKVFQKYSKADKYMVQNLTWSGVYLRNTLSSAILQKALKLLLLTATGPDVYVATMNAILSDSFDYLAETLKHVNSLKFKDFPGENFTDCCDAILVYAERLEISGAFNTKHLGCIIRIFDDTSDSRFRL